MAELDSRIINGQIDILAVVIIHLEQYPDHIEGKLDCKRCEFISNYILEHGF